MAILRGISTSAKVVTPLGPRTGTLLRGRRAYRYYSTALAAADKERALDREQHVHRRSMHRVVSLSLDIHLLDPMGDVVDTDPEAE